MAKDIAIGRVVAHLNTHAAALDSVAATLEMLVAISPLGQSTRASVVQNIEKVRVASEASLAMANELLNGNKADDAATVTHSGDGSEGAQG